MVKNDNKDGANPLLAPTGFERVGSLGTLVSEDGQHSEPCLILSKKGDQFLIEVEWADDIGDIGRLQIDGDSQLLWFHTIVRDTFRMLIQTGPNRISDVVVPLEFQWQPKPQPRPKPSKPGVKIFGIGWTMIETIVLIVVLIFIWLLLVGLFPDEMKSVMKALGFSL